MKDQRGLQSEGKVGRKDRRGWKTGIAALAVLLGLGLTFFGCSTAPDPWEEAGGEGPKVLVSFPPLYCFARQVGGDHARVLSLLTTVGPHDHSPTAHDALKALEADLFLVNGLGLDNWVGKIRNSSGNKNLKVVAVGDEIEHDLLIHIEEHADHGDHGHAHGHAHDHGDHDPHIWLGIDQAIAMVHVIRDQLSELAPEHRADFERNAQAYEKKLNALQAYGQKKFAGLKNKKIIPTHDSLAYFADSFGLEVVENIQPQPGVEPDAASLQRLVNRIKEEQVRVITVEPQYSKATAERLIQHVAKDVPDIRLATFDTLETVPSAAELTEDWYIEMMQKNIDELAKALQ